MNQPNRNSFSCLCFLLLTLPALTQVKIYVAPNGNDNNPGTISRPFKTPEHAIAHSLGDHNKNKAVSVELRQGVYYLDKTIVINAAGFLPASLQIKAYVNEKVTISAGKRLNLKWKPYKNGIYMATVPAGASFERLYVNQKLQPLARYPDYDSAARIFHGTAPDAIAQERVKRWKNPEGGYVHALHAYEWGGFHYRITGVDAGGNVQLEGGWQNNRPNEMHKVYRFVENIFEELDAPGEWWLDKAKHLLYYYPPKGVNLNDALIEVSHLKNSIELKGSMSSPLRNVQLLNLHFAHNERTFMDTKEPLLRSDWTIYRGGAVLLDGTENCKIADCVFEGIGGNAIMFSNYNKRDTVTGCHIYNTDANAVCFIGDTKAVRSPSFGYENYIPYNQLDKTPGPLTHNFPQECIVTDNLLHDLGDIEKQATGVQIEVAASITVSHNSIYHTSRAGINIGDGCFGGHILEFNDVFNTVRETGDHGSFNSWGRDRFWAPDRNYMDSLVAVHPELVLLDAQKQTIIRNNRFRCDHGWDIDLDDGSSNYHIYNNLCLNGGLKLREGFYRVVENNIMINNSFHPHVWFKNSGDVFERNIVMKKYAPIQVNDWGKSIDYNLFPDTAALHDAQSRGTDKHSLAGDPLFADPSKGDYTVAANSPALKAGFRNFPMNAFGVKKPALKKIALQPQLPVLITDEGLENKSVAVSFLGGAVKSVDGLGDRSAYGLPDETGVIVLSAGETSLLSLSGLRNKDVIRAAGGKAIADVKQLIDVYQSLNWTGQIPVTVMRNQQLVHIILKTR
ncbi:MAG TPA: PDZ domain-containing protein [Agriterribacter sp.]|uniref:PDZ domain-containing protein n=1 Tax=Agriterribacter sp. TaxID=2821509 RepID=UPI002CEEE8D4|nr:PDZ domain-containing protein [Agriterribacter sp.]HRQ15797.1 PDZ domain-containing protein [Agriterribacter sp.]